MSALFINPNRITIAQIADAGTVGRAILALNAGATGPVVANGDGTAEIITGTTLAPGSTLSSDRGVVTGS